MAKAAIDINQLSIAERLDLISDLWDSIPDSDYEDYLTPAQQAELDEIIAEVERNPEDCLTWEQVVKQVRERMR